MHIKNRTHKQVHTDMYKKKEEDTHTGSQRHTDTQTHTQTQVHTRKASRRFLLNSGLDLPLLRSHSGCHPTFHLLSNVPLFHNPH